MVAGASLSLRSEDTASYVELHAHSSHSLLDGVASPEDLVAQAAAWGMGALALTDHNGLYGAVRFVTAAKEAGIKPILGAEVTLEGGSHLTLLAENHQGYANLCRLLTLARRDQPKGTSILARRDLAAHSDGLIGLSGCQRGEIPVLLAEGRPEQGMETAQGYARLFGQERFFVEIQRHYQPGETRQLGQLMALADRTGLQLVATGDVHYVHPH